MPREPERATIRRLVGRPGTCSKRLYGGADWSVRALARAGRYTLSIHAERERQADRISMSELETALRSCEMIEDYPEDTRGHSFLVLGFADARPIHTVCTIKDDPREILLITVYDPSGRPEKWDAYFRRPRKR